MLKKNLGNILIIVGTLLGLATGATGIESFYSIAAVISELFMNLLKLVSLPIIFLAITATITSMEDWQEVQNLGRRVMKYTLSTTLIAASIALMLFIIINPVSHVLSSTASVVATTTQNSYLSFVLKIIPSNLVEAFRENNVIGVAFIAFLLGLASLSLPEENKKTLHHLFSSLFAALLKVTSFVISLMPIGIWAFMTLLVRDLNGQWENIHPIMLYVGVVLGANFIQGLIVLPLLLKARGFSPLKTARAVSPALLTAFLTKSSSATLPITIKNSREQLNISEKTANTSLPLCSIINMNGCAAFILTTVLFVSMSNGIHFSGFDMVMWVFLASLAAIGNAGVPMGCYFLASAFLVGMNVPLYIMGLILPIYAVIDMIETTLNVWSDITITAIVDKELKASELASTAITSGSLSEPEGQIP